MPGDERDFDDLLLMLKETRGFDFSGYKRSTLMRRIGRRLEALKLGDHSEYRDYLELHPEEFAALFDSLLINVTGFFRDPIAWAKVREDLLPALLSAKGAGAAVRVWSAGCATGEEAYSLAMLLAEHLGEEEFRARVKIYATDLDEKALQIARAAVYDERRLEAVPQDLRLRYFKPVEGGFAFRKELRNQVIFGRNDLIRDAPISRVDLLVARNTLMYFNTETQLSIVRRFHVAMADPGYLFLGKAEMPLNHSGRFEPVDLRLRLFKRVGPAPAGRAWTPGGGAVPYGRLPALEAAALAAAPVAQLTLDAAGKLALINTRAETMFGLKSPDVGRPFQDLEVSYRPVELRLVIEQVKRELRPAELRDVAWHRPGVADPDTFDISVLPLVSPGGDMLGVGLTFHDGTRYRRLRDELEQTNRELEHAYEELQQFNDVLNAREGELDSANRFVDSILDGLGDGVAVIDEQLTVQRWNTGAEDLWGIRADEALDQPLASLDIGLPVDRLTPAMRLLLDGGRPESADEQALEAVNRRGRHVRIKVELMPLRQGCGRVDALLMVMRLL